ncbi:HEAT repeat domain-containing protein [Halopiger djelfimassiliensis]|uniref:HEAT repeat domain-containing protein n=1 Tax=Halopiger djelfimassiliensis TaxID=1293047 RepID=UPI000677840E|nr:HEAT repeat domain-containing protein [Halopiger djelfimassiliensis]
MVAEWLLEAEAQPPEVPADSDIADALAALKRNPMDTDQLPKIDSGLASDDLSEVYGAIRCLNQLVDHTPNAVEQRLEDVLEAVSETENRFLVSEYLELDASYCEIAGSATGDVTEYTGIIGPEQNPSIRGPAMVSLSYSVKENPFGFRHVNEDVATAIIDAYPSVQVPAIRTLRHAVTSNTGTDGGEYVDRLTEASSSPDDEVRAAALETLGEIATREPDAVRDAVEEIVAALDSPVPEVRSSAVETAYNVSLFSQESLTTAIPTLLEIAADETEDDEMRLLAGFAVVWTSAYPGAVEYIDPASALELVDEEAGSDLAQIGAYAVYLVADDDPSAVVDIVPTLVTRLETDPISRREALDDHAGALGNLATERPDAVESVAETLVDAIDEPTSDTDILGRELAHIALRAPAVVAEALDVRGETKWPEDGLGDHGLAPWLCRGLLADVTPGYVDPVSERTEKLIQTVATAHETEQNAGVAGDCLKRIARTAPSLLHPYVETIEEGLCLDAPPLRRDYAEVLAILGERDALRQPPLPCQTLEAVTETAIESVDRDRSEP